MWVDVTAETLRLYEPGSEGVMAAVKRSLWLDADIAAFISSDWYFAFGPDMTCHVMVPRRVRDKIRAADRGQPVKPFSFKFPDVLE